MMFLTKMVKMAISAFVGPNFQIHQNSLQTSRNTLFLQFLCNFLRFRPQNATFIPQTCAFAPHKRVFCIKNSIFWGEKHYNPQVYVAPKGPMLSVGNMHVCFHLSICTLLLEHVQACSRTCASFQLSMCMLSFEHVHTFS